MQRYVDCYAGLIEDGKMYIPGVTYAVLWEYDLNNWERRCLMSFMDIFEEQPIRAMAVFKEGEYIYLVLRNTYRILECNTGTGQAVWIGEQPVFEDAEEIILNAFRIGDEIWSIPGDIQNVIQIFNIKTRDFSELSVVEQMDGYENISGFLDGAVCGDSIYLPAFEYQSCNLICQIVCKEKTIKMLPLEENFFLHTLSVYGNEVWLSDFRDPSFPELCRWERERGVLETIRLGRCEWRERDNYKDVSLFREIVAYNKKLIIIPHYSNEIIVFDREQNKERRLLYPAGFQRVAASEGKEMFRGICVQKEQVFLFPCAYNGLLILNMETEELEFRELHLDREDYEAYYKIHFRERCKEEKIFSEGEVIPYDRGEFLLADYIEQIEMDETNVRNEKRVTSGKRIYDYITGGKSEK